MRFLSSINAAVFVLLLTIGAGYYVDAKNDQMRDRHLAITTGLEKMVRLSLDLTNMLLISVLEQNTLRTASYDTVSADLQTTIQTVGALAKQQNLSEEMSALAQDHRQLRLVEAQALQLMQRDQWTEAHAMLFDETYVMAKKIYEINSETAAGALTGEMSDTASRFEKIRQTALGMRLAALLLLLWVGAMFSRRLRMELLEQTRLRDAIAVANQALEEKVHLRTLELEAANRQLQTLSTTDGLTGIANRRSFDSAWESEWQRASRHGLPLALIMIDVDQFKAYNDHYGHQAGDACLQRLAQIFDAAVQRTGELAARYGGEEFILILPGLNGDEACALAEKIRAKVQALGLPHAMNIALGVVTISLGVASNTPQHDTSSHALIEAADGAMYRAKQQGRNQVQLAV